MLLGTALVRMEETSASAEPVCNFQAPPLTLHIPHRAELISTQALLVFLLTLFNARTVPPFSIFAAIPVNPTTELLIFKAFK